MVIHMNISSSTDGVEINDVNVFRRCFSIIVNPGVGILFMPVPLVYMVMDPKDFQTLRRLLSI